MSQAFTYEDWKLQTQQEDEASGAANWKVVDKSKRYDYSLIRKRFNELVEIR